MISEITNFTLQIKIFSFTMYIYRYGRSVNCNICMYNVYNVYCIMYIQLYSRISISRTEDVDL